VLLRLIRRRCWCSFRPATADGQPVIDRVPGLDNAWVSAGHDGTGLLLAPATGQALATWITTSRQPQGSPPSASPGSTGIG
jgi:glycine/D-amino acid oxidase-like deaminating enzyme